MANLPRRSFFSGALSNHSMRIALGISSFTTDSLELQRCRAVLQDKRYICCQKANLLHKRRFVDWVSTPISNHWSNISGNGNFGCRVFGFQSAKEENIKPK